MKFTITKDQLSDGVAKAERITGKNLSLPVLRCVLCIAENNKLTLRATNLDLGIEITLAANVSNEGTVAIPADTLHSFLSAISASGQVTVEEEGNQVIVTSAKSTTRIATYPHEDFPVLPKVEDGELFRIDARELAAGLRSVWWSASPASIKPELSSVYVSPDGDTLVCVATDSFRLAEKKIHAKKVGKFESLLLPLKNIGEIIRHAESHTGEIVVRGNTHQIACTLDETYITSRVIDGVFPDYKQIMPKEFETEATLLKQDVVDALKHARIFSDQFNKLTVMADPNAKEFIFSTTNAEVGEATIKLDAALTGAKLQMHFNHQYVLDAFQAIGSDSVVFAFSGTGKPVLIRSVGDQSFSYIVMPMNR